MARGKKVTYSQRLLLNDAGISDTRDWEYIGQQISDQSGYKSVSKNEPKTITSIFRNKKTGQEKRIEVEA